MHPELKALRLQEIASDLARLLRDGNAIEFQSAPRGDADLAQMKGCAEPLAKFLLNPMVRALRLHIQVDPEQDGEGQDHEPRRGGRAEVGRVFSPDERYATGN